MLTYPWLAFDRWLNPIQPLKLRNISVKLQSKPIRVSNSADSETVEPGSNFIGQSDFQNNGEISDVEGKQMEENSSSEMRRERHIPSSSQLQDLHLSEMHLA
jgi:hypothetical protein